MSEARWSPSPAALLAAGSQVVCGAIHVAALRAHQGQPTSHTAFFASVALAQLLGGVLTLRYWGPRLRWLSALLAVGVTGVWIASRTIGVASSGIEPVGLGDAIAASLQTITAVLAWVTPVGFAVKTAARVRSGITISALSVGAIALSVPATLNSSEDDSPSGQSISAVWAAHGGHAHQQPKLVLTGNGIVKEQPKDCKPTDTEVDSADSLVARTTLALQKYDDVQLALKDGFTPLGFEPNGVYHYIQPDYRHDRDVLNPDRPESIVYGKRPDGVLRPIGVMFMASNVGDRGPRPGGCLMTWHTHGFPFAQPGEETVEMIHVWVVPIPGGPFAHESGPDYARIYLNRTAVDAGEVNNLLTSFSEKFRSGKVEPAALAALGVLARGGQAMRCGKPGRDAMTTLSVSKALQDQVCDPFFSDPVPGAENSSLFRTLARGISRVSAS